MSSFDLELFNPYILHKHPSRDTYHPLVFGYSSGIKGVCKYWCNHLYGTDIVEHTVNFYMPPEVATREIKKYVDWMKMPLRTGDNWPDYYFFDSRQTPRAEWESHLNIFLQPWRNALVAAKSQNIPIHIKIEW